MRKFFSQNCLGQEISRRAASLFLAATLAVLAGCGSGSAVPTSSGTGGTTTGTGGTSGTTAAPTLTLALTNAAGATVSSISIDAPATVKATLKDAAGALVPNAVVSFSTDAALATIIPAATALTNAAGVATVTLKPATSLAVGAATITAAAQLGTAEVTGAIGFAIEATASSAGAPTFTLTLTNAAGATVSTISKDAPALVKATLKDAAGVVVPNAVVTFGTDAALATIVPAATALTNASGVASITLTPASNLAVGATTITAGARVGTVAVTGAINFAVEATTTPRGAPTLSLALTDAAGATVASITSVAPGTVKATLTDGTGALVPNAVVTFSTDASLATVTPAVTALTNASGVATVTVQPSNLFNSGAAIISATAQAGTAAVTSSLGYAVGSVAFTVSAPVLGIGAVPLSAFGTTSITVGVSIGGVPIDSYCTSLVDRLLRCDLSVIFSSPCGNAGKAVMTSASTVGGVVTGTYRDNGCAGTDVITATVAGVASPTTSLVITPQTTGSIQFVSATPSSISLKGIGGVEASQVRFKVLDTGGNPLSGKTVTFGLSTTVGGITLTPSTPDTATSDASGLVVTTVNSGTVSTPVRVTASTPGATAGTTLTTQSSGLTITTGIPDQDSFSLSATVYNPEFGNIEGNTTVIAARLADHFNNPAPNGTIVNFTTEGGSIVASCSTVIDSDGNSNCSSILTSQAPRPANGRVTVLAYAVGEESFIDLNGNGVADLVPNEMIDSSSGVSVSTDLSEAFRDDNENGVRDANETFIDFNQNGTFDGPDGKYSGVLCNNVTSPPSGSSVGTCSSNKTIHVRGSVVIVYSGSTAVITKIAPTGTINLGGNCGGASQQVDLRVVDVNGNPMPMGTTIAVATTDGTISGASSFTQANTNVTLAPGVANYSVSVRDDGSQTSTLNTVTGVTTVSCTDTTLSGVLTVTVTTPGAVTIPGTITTAQFAVIN